MSSNRSKIAKGIKKARRLNREQEDRLFMKLPERVRRALKEAPYSYTPYGVAAQVKKVGEEAWLAHFAALVSQHVRVMARQYYGPDHPQAIASLTCRPRSRTSATSPLTSPAACLPSTPAMAASATSSGRGLKSWRSRPSTARSPWRTRPR